MKKIVFEKTGNWIIQIINCGWLSIELTKYNQQIQRPVYELGVEINLFNYLFYLSMGTTKDSWEIALIPNKP